MSERFSMNNWQPLTMADKQMRIDDEINEIDEKRQPLIIRKQEIELSLSEYNNKIRKVGGLSDNEYNDICQRQEVLKKEKQAVESQLMDFRQQVRKKHAEKDKIYLQSKKIPDGEVKKILLEMRDKYMSFAADTTRVSSMRAMSARFVEEIQTILKFVE